MKHKLIFDVTDADTIADSDSVGAFIRSSDGTLITHTTVGGKEALDVRVAEGINVEVDLSHVDDSVRLGDGTTLTTVTSNGGKDGLDVFLINTDITVTATDLDIRDLSAAQDSVAAWTNDGTGNAIGSTAGALNVFIDNSNPVQVNDAALADTAIEAASNDLTVANTAESVKATALANRKYLYVYNNGNREIYIGGAGVSEADGFPVAPGGTYMFRAGAAIDMQWVGPNTSQNIRTLELS